LNSTGPAEPIWPPICPPTTPPPLRRHTAFDAAFDALVLLDLRSGMSGGFSSTLGISFGWITVVAEPWA